MPINTAALLAAIAVVASRGKDDAESKNSHGMVVARGRYQITEPVWFRHSSLAWEFYAHSHTVAATIVEAHVEEIRYDLFVQKIPITPIAIYGCWLEGTDAFIRQLQCKRVPAKTKAKLDKFFRVYKEQRRK